jgi:hypothetical protein
MRPHRPSGPLDRFDRTTVLVRRAGRPREGRTTRNEPKATTRRFSRTGGHPPEPCASWVGSCPSHTRPTAVPQIGVRGGAPGSATVKEAHQSSDRYPQVTRPFDELTEGAPGRTRTCGLPLRRLDRPVQHDVSSPVTCGSFARTVQLVSSGSSRTREFGVRVKHLSLVVVGNHGSARGSGAPVGRRRTPPRTT